MKLLLDENLSDRIVPQLLDLYPDSAHVKWHGLLDTDDILIWSFARENGYTIVSKDADFHQRSLVFGHPPKLIYLRVGNCSTSQIVDLLRGNYVLFSECESNEMVSILFLP